MHYFFGLYYQKIRIKGFTESLTALKAVFTLGLMIKSKDIGVESLIISLLALTLKEYFPGDKPGYSASFSALAGDQFSSKPSSI